LIPPSNDEANSEEMASGNISTASPQKQKKVSSNVFGFNDPKCKQKRVDKFISVPIPMTAQVMGHYKSEDGNIKEVAIRNTCAKSSETRAVL
jgi:hypothetical protein